MPVWMRSEFVTWERGDVDAGMIPNRGGGRIWVVQHAEASAFLDLGAR